MNLSALDVELRFCADPARRAELLAARELQIRAGALGLRVLSRVLPDAVILRELPASEKERPRSP